MKRLLIIGCGDVGLRVAMLLRPRHRIYALTRDAERCAALRDHGLTPLTGDLDRPATLAGLAGLAHDVIHLAPPPAAGSTSPVPIPVPVLPLLSLATTCTPLSLLRGRSRQPRSPLIP